MTLTSPALHARAAWAADAAQAGFEATRTADALTRQRWLLAIADALEIAAIETSRDITADTGKPTKWATIEVERAISILRLAAAEVLGLHPQAQHLDAQPSGVGRLAITVREPRGPVLALCPFNFPLHLTVHKLAGAIASGASTVIVMSPRTPRTAAALALAIAGAGLPDGAVSIVEPDADHVLTWQLINDSRLPVISFTGSDAVGWRIVDAVPRKHVITELGGNSAAVIAPDAVGDADLRYAAERIALFAFYNAGQACTSVQRVYVPADALDSFARDLVAAAQRQDLAEDVGPLIDIDAADRVRNWVAEAVAAGAVVATGGDGDGRFVVPTVLVGTPAHTRCITDEVFGPVVSIIGYEDLDEAFGLVNASRFGLSSGVFTHDIRIAAAAVTALRTGQVVIGDAPTFRSDVTGFGGIKDSGRGREGIRATIDDYTLSRTAVFAEAAL